MERLHGPALPYARAMLGARTAHEWAHLAVAAGWVPRTVVARASTRALRAALAAALDAAIAAAPAAVRRATAADLARARRASAAPAHALARLTAHPHARLPGQPGRARFLDAAPSARPTCATTSARCAPSTRRRSSGACWSATSSSTSTCAPRSGCRDRRSARVLPVHEHLVRRRLLRHRRARRDALRRARRRGRPPLRVLRRRRAAAAPARPAPA